MPSDWGVLCQPVDWGRTRGREEPRAQSPWHLLLLAWAGTPQAPVSHGPVCLGKFELASMTCGQTATPKSKPFAPLRALQ